MAKAVFISFSSKDQDLARQVLAAIEEAGIGAWISFRDAKPGELYSESIVDAISACKIVVLVLSRNSVASQEVLREVEVASRRGVPIIQFTVEPVTLPKRLEYFLSLPQRLEAFPGPVTGHLPKLIAALRPHAGGSAPAAQESSPATRAEPQRRPVLRLGNLGCAASVIFGGIVMLIAALEAGGRGKVFLHFVSDRDKPVQGAEVVVARLAEPTLTTPKRREGGTNTRTISQSITDENGTVVFTIVREDQMLRISVKSSGEFYSEDVHLSKEETKQRVVERTILIPAEYLVDEN